MKRRGRPSISPFIFGGRTELPVIAPGVRGIVTPGETLYVVLIEALVEGSGDVGRFIDGLPKNKDVVFCSVINTKLAKMLERRGYQPEGHLGDWSRVAISPPTTSGIDTALPPVLE